MAVETDHDFAVSLPPDVITEILSRLPVRSILRFKSVCKSWYALFSDPIFVEKHLKASTENKDYANHRLIINSIYSMDVASCSIPSVLHQEHSTAVHPLDYPSRSSDPEVWIVGSVNGLVLIMVDKVGVFLWNPATRESNRLPPNGFEGCSALDHDIVYGFAYDESSSDYKVVVLNTDYRRDLRPFSNEVKVYELKRNSWRKIDYSYMCDLIGDHSGKFVSGALHWLAWIYTGGLKIMGLLTFNLSEDDFSEILLPYEYDARGSWDLIGVLDGCLSVSGNSDGTKVDLWVMKEYGKIESWCKMFSLTFQPCLGGCYEITPLFISGKNEVLLMVNHMDLVLYNMESNTVHRRVIQDFRNITTIDTYIETLISPYH